MTLEAVAPLLDQPVEGFGELFRMLSYQQVGAAAMLSRAAAGLAAGKAVFLLPGSPKAVALAMEELILPEAAHLISQAKAAGSSPGGAPREALSSAGNSCAASSDPARSEAQARASDPAGSKRAPVPGGAPRRAGRGLRLDPSPPAIARQMKQQDQEPMMAITRLRQSKPEMPPKPSAVARKPPSSAPTTPMMTVMMQPPGSLPRHDHLGDQPGDQAQHDPRNQSHSLPCRLLLSQRLRVAMTAPECQTRASEAGHRMSAAMTETPRAPRLFLIDGYSNIFRAFYAIRNLSNSRGRADQRRLRLRPDAAQAPARGAART